MVEGGVRVCGLRDLHPRDHRSRDQWFNVRWSMADSVADAGARGVRIVSNDSVGLEQRSGAGGSATMGCDQRGSLSNTLLRTATACADRVPGDVLSLCE